MKIWTVEYKSKMVSFATEQITYQYVSKLLAEIVNDRNAYRYDPQDPFTRIFSILIRENEHKLAFEFYEKYKNHSGIKITENELTGHVME